MLSDSDFGKITFKNPNALFNFKCTRCAECCKNMKLRLTSLDIKALCDRLKLSTRQFHLRYTSIAIGKNKLPLYLLKTRPECVFHKKGCIVYESRPTSCRMYPFGTYHVFDKIYYFKVKDCPGFRKKRKTTINSFIAESQADNLLSFINRWELINNIELDKIEDKAEFVNLYKQLLFFFDSMFTKMFIKENKLERYGFEDKILYFINYLLEYKNKRIIY